MHKLTARHDKLVTIFLSRLAINNRFASSVFPDIAKMATFVFNKKTDCKYAIPKFRL